MFFITGLAYGGAETQLVNLAIRLKERGWDVRVVSMLPPQAFTEELKEAGIPLATLNMRRGVAELLGVATANVVVNYVQR